MSEWSVALDAHVNLTRFCQRFTSFEDMQAGAYQDRNGEAHTPEFFGEDDAKAVQRVGFDLLRQPVSMFPPYYFTADTVALLRQAWPQYPTTSRAPAEAMFLSNGGFWYFADPVSHMVFMPKGTEHLPIGVRAIQWARFREGIFYVVCLDDPGGSREFPMPVYFGTWPGTNTIEQAAEQAHRSFDGMYPDDEVQWIVSGVKSHKQILGAGLAFCAQRVFLDSPEPADRPTRRRAEAALDYIEPAPDVHVIRLRRSTVHEAVEEGRDVDWSCRWWVRGHWRQQACGPERSERVPTWINSYVKGPDDKPMKPPASTVFAVVR